jgi:hypothetical protein
MFEKLLRGRDTMLQAFVIFICLRVLLSREAQRQSSTEETKHHQAAGDTPPPAEPSGRRVRVLCQRLDLLFEGIETGEQVIHGRGPSRWSTDDRDQQADSIRLEGTQGRVTVSMVVQCSALVTTSMTAVGDEVDRMERRMRYNACGS